MLADEARAKSEETRSLCGWDPRDDDDDTISRVSVYATLPRKSKWGSLKSLFSRKSDASIDLGPEDIENGEEEEEDDDGFFKKLGKKGFRRAKSTTSISSCPPEVGTTKPRKQKSYRRSKSNTVARPLGVWQEEESYEAEDRDQEQESSRPEPQKVKSYLRDESSLRIRPEKKTSIFSPRSSISSILKKKEKDEIDRPARPLVLPVGDSGSKPLIRDYDSHRYRSLAIEDEVLKPKNRLSLDFGKNSKSDRIYQNGSTHLSNYTPQHTPTSKDKSWRTTSLTQNFTLRRKKIQNDDVYVHKMRDILNAYPTRGPPYNMTMLCSNMYMGSQKNADDIGMLRRFGITHVLNMAGTRKMNYIQNPYKPNSGVLHYLMIPAQDYEDYDIARHLPEALAFLDHAKRNGGKALVHCNMGVNRSGAVCAAYLMADQKMNLLEVTKYLKLKRTFVLVNRGFQKQMVEFAREKNLLEPL